MTSEKKLLWIDNLPDFPQTVAYTVETLPISGACWIVRVENIRLMPGNEGDSTLIEKVWVSLQLESFGIELDASMSEHWTSEHNWAERSKKMLTNVFIELA